MFHYLLISIFALQFIRRNPPKGVNATPLRLLSASRKDITLRPVLGVFLCVSASRKDFYSNKAIVAVAEKGGNLHMNKLQQESGLKEVFCRFIRTKAGKIIYPKTGTCFHFFVKA